jgi:very-short-patch-repair endonuclease
MSAPPFSRSHAIGHADRAAKRLTLSVGSGCVCAGINWVCRRQHPIGPYIVDFCCVERVLIVELDGGQHEDQRAQDAARTQWLGEQGFRVLRFSDREALIETEAVLAEIQNRL